MSRFTRYIHHGRKVSVAVVLKGNHRNYCLCYDCLKFKPGRKENCNKAEALYRLCVLFGTVTPVWECPDFKEGQPAIEK